MADWSEDPEFAPVPPWLREAVDAAFADLQRPAPVEVLLGWDPGEAILWVSEANESGRSGFEAPHDMRGAALVVALSDWLQDQFFPETRGAWGQARPECPGPRPSAGGRRGSGQAMVGVPGRWSSNRGDRRRGLELRTPEWLRVQVVRVPLLCPCRVEERAGGSRFNSGLSGRSSSRSSPWSDWDRERPLTSRRGGGADQFWP